MRTMCIVHNTTILVHRANKQGDQAALNQAAAVAARPFENILGQPPSPFERKAIDPKAYEELEARIRNLRAEQKKVSADPAPAAVAAGSNETPRKH